MIKQISVFLSNRLNKLEQMTQILRENEVNIVSFCLSDTAEYGVARMIVSEPEKARTVLEEAGFSVGINNVLAVHLPNQPGMMNELVKLLSNTTIEYLYAMGHRDGYMVMIVKVVDMYSAMALLGRAGYTMPESEEVYRLGDWNARELSAMDFLPHNVPLKSAGQGAFPSETNTPGLAPAN